MRTLLLVAVAALAGCTRPVSPPGADLAQLVSGRVAGPPQSCIPSEAGANIHAVDSANVAYGSGRTVYVSHLLAECSGLRDFSTIIIETHGAEYCRGDLFRSVDMGASIPGPICVLGDWVPYRRP